MKRLNNNMEKREELKDFLNIISEGDCIKILKNIPDNSIDLIFADPPYNLQLQNDLYRPNIQTKVNAVNDKWDKFASFEEYDKFSQEWLKECRRVLKDNGTIWVIGSYHNIFRIGKIIQDLGFWILNDVVWIKQNPMPNFKGTRFNNAHETLIWAAKSSKSKFTFHYKGMKVFNDDKQMRSDWYIPICLGNERLKINGEKVHSTQKPEALLYRIILSTSNINDTVLDPFMGSGTTGAMAKMLKRNFIGIENNSSYIKFANERIEKIELIDEDLLKYPIEKKKPKVPFGNLIEIQVINISEYLFSKDKQHKAQVLADGSLKYQDEVGSIHKISAKILEKPANNGWDFWYVEREGNLKSINDLRDEYIEKFLFN
jgi:DNA modification methylase